MALITGSDTLGSAFTPAVGVFRIQVSRKSAKLQSRAVEAADWVDCGPDLANVDLRVGNTIAGVQYRFTGEQGAVTRADQ